MNQNNPYLTGEVFIHEEFFSIGLQFLLDEIIIFQVVLIVILAFLIVFISLKNLLLFLPKVMMLKFLQVFLVSLIQNHFTWWQLCVYESLNYFLMLFEDLERIIQVNQVVFFKKQNQRQANLIIFFQLFVSLQVEVVVQVLERYSGPSEIIFLLIFLFVKLQKLIHLIHHLLFDL